MSALSRIRKAGFDAFLYGGSFKVFPASKLTQSRREFLKAHKDEIIDELQGKTGSIKITPSHYPAY